MEELEQKTYLYTVQGIGLVKSLEKHYPELASQELKGSIGAVSLKYLAALQAKENTEFAKNLRESNSNAKKSLEILESLKGIKEKDFVELKNELIDEAKYLVDRLDKVIEKLIF